MNTLLLLAAVQQALVGGTVIDGKGGVIEDGVVLVEGDRIACVGTRRACPVPDNVTVTDVKGRFLTPGLVDAHVHFAQTGWLDGRPDGLQSREPYPYEEVIAELRADPGRWHRSYLCSGTTAVFDVGGAPWTVQAAQVTDEGRAERVHVRAAGPLITHASGINSLFAFGPLIDEPTFLPMESAEQIRSDVARLKAMGSAAVKVWFLPPPTSEDAPRLDALMMEAGAAAREAGLPLIVHATELVTAKTALKAGAHMLVHSVADVPVDREFLDLLVESGATYAPTLVVGHNWTRAVFSAATGEAVNIGDANRCVDEALATRIAQPEVAKAAMLARSGGRVMPFGARMKADGIELATMAANLRAVRDAGGRIALATDAGNPLTLHGPSVNEELEAMQAAGMTPDELIAAASLAGAHAMGMADDIGSLEHGKVADLLILEKDPRADIAAYRSLTHVMRAGVLKTQAELRVR